MNRPRRRKQKKARLKIHPIALIFLVLIVFCFGWAAGFGSAAASAVTQTMERLSSDDNTSTTHSDGSSTVIIGNGAQRTVKRACPAFDAIDVAGALDVNISCQKPQGVSVSGDDNLVPLVHTQVRDHTLYITSGSYSTNAPIKITVNTPNIGQITSSGSNTIAVSNMDNDQLKIEDSGAGNIHLSGATDSLDVTSSGSSTITADSLTASQVTVDISGASKVTVGSVKSLSARVSGAGTVTYSGHPQQLHSVVTGAGSVQDTSSDE
jgi:hypothetical protein